MKGTILFDIKEYWHAGAGHGAGRLIDATVVKTPAGLPYLPGKSVKGLLRQAVLSCETWGHLEAGTTDRLFGTRAVGRFETTPGVLAVSDATLGEQWERWARTEEGHALSSSFFADLSSTSLDEFRVANERTLRRIEVAIPVALTASWEVIGEGGEEAFTALKTAAPLLRMLGSSRHRGLGRVSVSVALGEGGKP